MRAAIRRARPEDAQDIAALVEAGFAAAVAPHFNAEGCRTFRRFAAADAIAVRLAAGNAGWVAVAEGVIIGYAEMDRDHMRLLFVDPRHQGLGLGRRLLERALEGRQGRTVTVNSAPNAEAYYRHMGFRPAGPLQVKDGIAFVPMARGT